MPKIASLDPALVAAAGLTPNVASNVEDIARAIEEAPALRKRLGIDTLGSLRRIGVGSWARVYRLPDGRVLKLTTDASDAAAASLVAGAVSRPAGLAPVYEVVKFPWPVRDKKWDPIRGVSGSVTRDLYAIVMGYVSMAKEESPEEDLADQIASAMASLVEDAGFNQSSPLAELRRRQDDDLTPWLWDLVHGWMWLAERGWEVNDIFATNIGFLDGEVVFVDMGLSSTQRSEMPEFSLAANPPAIDNERGLGNTPNNGNVDYLGMRVLMKPSTFLMLAAPLVDRRARTMGFLPGYMKDGGAISSPSLYIEIPAEWDDGDLSGVARVQGHEGRHRMTVIEEMYGDDPIEVHLFPVGFRNRHLTSAWISALNSGLVPEWSRSKVVPGPLFDMPHEGLAMNGARSMKSVVACFDRCFEIVRDQFPDFGEIELHEDAKAGGDNGNGSERQFGYCMDVRPIVIAFAPKTDGLATPFIEGLMRHEFGHALDFRYGKQKLERHLGTKLPAGVERRADAIAGAVFGDQIAYGGPNLVQCVRCHGRSPRPKHLGA
jgi:hypothetical protein